MALIRRGVILAVGACCVLRAGVLSAQAGRVRVDIVGLRGEERRNVLATLSIAAATAERSVTEARVRRLHDRAPGEIALALEPFGRYRVKVSPALSYDGRSWRARYTVDPGSRVIIRRVDVTVTGDGAEEPRFARWRADFALRKGDPLNHATYELAKTRFMNLAAELGYLDGRFTEHAIRIDRTVGVADIELRYVTGPRFRFGTVTFDQGVVDSALLAGFVRFRRGEVFSATRLLELQAALGDSPYFARVEVVPRRDLAEDFEVPIEVHLVPRRPQRYQVGAGFGTNTGPRGSVEAAFRRLNRAGHRAELEVSASVVERRVAGRYLIPFAYPRTAVLSGTAGYANRTLSTSSSETVLAGLSLVRSRGRWRESVGLTFQREGFEVGSDTGTVNQLTPSLAWSLTRADDRIFTTRGGRLRFEIQGAKRGVGSEVSFVQARIGCKVIERLGPRTRLLVRADAGGLLTDAFRTLPPSVRFFAGGDQSVRGYEYQSLGPTDELQNVIGGKVLLVGSVELEQRFLNRWGVAAFADAGNALSRVSLTLETGLGGGLRWLSPVGLIRLDGAFAVSQPGSPFRVHLTVGPDL
jgi:translocation and assembly module TamA